VEDDERRRREEEHPKELVPVARAHDRVRRDPGRIVVGEAREQARPEHHEHRRKTEPPQGRAERWAAVAAAELLDKGEQHGGSTGSVGDAPDGSPTRARL